MLCPMPNRLSLHKLDRDSRRGVAQRVPIEGVTGRPSNEPGATNPRLAMPPDGLVLLADDGVKQSDLEAGSLGLQ